jgi:fibronectin-binding autotransporter adhesin
MADRYWVGGTAAWDGTAGTKWATTDGGAGGASVPTSADAVFFTALSGANTVTISTGNTGALSINCTGFTGTLAGTAAITVSGSVTLVAGMTVTYSGTLTLNGTGTLTTAGKTPSGNLTINGSGITVTLGDNLNIASGSLTLTLGTLTTANNAINAVNFLSNNTNTRTINFGSSIITLSGTGTCFSIGTVSTGLTFNAGTSEIRFTAGSSTGISSPGLTFYNVSCTATSVTSFAIQGVNTFNNLSVTAPSAAGVTQVTFDSRQTINGTLSTTGTAGNRRVWFRGVTYGIAQTLTVNAAPSLTDADFRDIYVIGTAAPISGTRVGDLRGCRGITFSTPKTVYWVTLAGGNWSGNNWAASSGGAASTDNFPLAQDTAVIENTGLNTSATVTMDSAVPYTGAVTMSTRTNAMTLSLVITYTIYGNWTNGSGTTLSGAQTLTFSGRNTQTITSAGKTFSGGITVDSYGGSIELDGDLNIGTNTLSVINGTFDTKNFNIVAAGRLSSSGNGVRNIVLGSSTLTLSNTIPVQVTGTTNLTLSAGTSQINVSATGNTSFGGGGLTYYNVSYTGTTASVHAFVNSSTFNSLTITAPASAGLTQVTSDSNQTITGTLTVAGASPVRRIFVLSNTLGTTRTLTVGTLSATDCDFRDITIAGSAAGSSPTRAGDCGGNSGITFPAAKTVYWNLAGTQNWSATGWAPSSGGTPDINQFPLAQDTAVFDNTGSVGTVTVQAAWNIGTLNMSARTSACTIDWSNGGPFIHGNVLLGSGVTPGTIGFSTFAGRGTQTITSAGNTWSGAITVDCVTGTVQLADALTLIAARTLTLTSGTFDAVSYNVTTGLVSLGSTILQTLKMGSGTWTLSGTGNVWLVNNTTNFNFYKGTANIVLSDTSTTARTFVGNGLSYNKLTIGGTTGTSTTTITQNNQFTELASTKTVAHTIALGATTQTFGKWTVTGTAGNVVTLTGTGTSHVLAGAATSGIDYLAMGSIGFAATSPGEFYAGANSTGTAAAPVYRTAKPADSTRYWVGGTGNWSDTARWSTSSGGGSGASVPRSHDDVVFDSASNATAYTATVNAVTGGIRMKSLTIAGPASGNVTLAGSTAIDGIHGSVTLPATGLTRTYTGVITLSGSTSGKTLTTNGVTLSSSIELNGVGCEWSLGFNLSNGSEAFTLTNGSFDLVSYNFTTGLIASNLSTNARTINFGSGIITLSSVINFGTTENIRANLTVIAGTSQINISNISPTFSGNNQTFYNVAFTSTSAGTVTINGANSFNNLSFTGITSAGLKVISVTANQTITGTFTCSAGTDATMRHFVQSNTLGTTRTITAAAVSLTDVDFRDITIAGAAAPATGTRLGDCKGNSGITFTAAANKYWNLAAGGNWGGAIGWATASGGTPAINNFPLAQDTCFFEATGLNSGATVTINAAYNIGTINMSARTANTMTLATGTTTPTIYGNWINGTGTTLSGTGTLTFAGRVTQDITSAGKSFTQILSFNSPSGAVRLQDAFNSGSSGHTFTAGTFDCNGYNATWFRLATSGSLSKTYAVGSGTTTVTGGGTSAFDMGAGTNVSVTGTGVISLTSASAQTFGGGGISYSGITLDQGGAGTLTISGNNTFANITNTYKATGATAINFGTTTQRVGNFTAAGEAGRLLTLTGSSASSPCTLVHTSTGTAANVDYLVITGVRAY